jgi:predicted house-cleaning NTP pyrophosphatase (Maf/HAM1 superfamily)
MNVRKMMAYTAVRVMRAQHQPMPSQMIYEEEETRVVLALLVYAQIKKYIDHSYSKDS